MNKQLESSSGGGAPSTPGIFPEVGQYVLVRSQNEGINCGFVVAADETGILLASARRLSYHKPAVKSESWYEGVANHGLADDSEISSPVARKGIIEDYSWVALTEKAQKSIMELQSYAQS